MTKTALGFVLISIAVVAAALGFANTPNYRQSQGFIWNLRNASIVFDRAGEPTPYIRPGFADCGARPVDPGPQPENRQIDDPELQRWFGRLTRKVNYDECVAANERLEQRARLAAGREQRVVILEMPLGNALVGCLAVAFAGLGLVIFSRKPQA